jgi:glycosyltransferase involved in cell wall biosynthesis
MEPGVVAIVTAYDEADRLPATLAALASAFPGARLVVADDGSRDGTGHAALQAGAELVRAPRMIGKGGAATLAAEHVMAAALVPDPPVFLLCDADLGESAARLPALVGAVRRAECDLAIAAFARRVGGGVGAALGVSRWAIRRRCGAEMSAPLSGQRALRAEVLPAVVPFAAGFGMETAMTIDAVRAGFRVAEVEVDLEHRATGRTLRGFAHRGRQLVDIVRAYLDRR